ncbi:hypothetical protein LEP1GSC168_0011 [Leptospira santarosai str. HAI134]|uniref:Uncharacterized protein n=1 Tax=Leptospira santarosai str. ZUN179 TaxID=1049985 RepID=M6V2S4_9LEPT|nr:hypothetical protein [Leptospira santarosai]EKR89733.1 hypothetical protein LEP1GSC163_0179 [Leptospira santarosai str. CBC379]EMO12461.1 hypothetical protein LEP1GSC165_0007 [Leptospira santarosai str. CBC523]EMO20720.1 hypothetical protein LEP1GSC168_0011 [Leptospira santarosai str. HAI134]EMO43828.1 hypothetical protein LEP1GSC187_0470 [Leptospira santarosai str. ZUN179]
MDARRELKSLFIEFLDDVKKDQDNITTLIEEYIDRIIQIFSRKDD